MADPASTRVEPHIGPVPVASALATDELRAAVENAKPFLAFRVERVLGKANLGSPEGRARAAEAAVGIVAEHPNELVRDQYLVQIADRCRIDADRLREFLDPTRKQRRPPPAAAPDRPAKAP